MGSVSTTIYDSIQGWDDCVCLDLNAFYLGLVSEEERCRVESLELFDEHEVSWDVIVLFWWGGGGRRNSKWLMHIFKPHTSAPVVELLFLL